MGCCKQGRSARSTARGAGEQGVAWYTVAVVSSVWGSAWAVKCRVAPIVLLRSGHHGDGQRMAGGLLGVWCVPLAGPVCAGGGGREAGAEVAAWSVLKQLSSDIVSALGCDAGGCI